MSNIHMNIIECVAKSLEFEKNNMVPYTIDNQIFKSNRTYPSYICIHEKVNEFGNMEIKHMGETILGIKSKSGNPFKFKFTDNPEIFVSDLDGIFRFENGLPILPSRFMTILDVKDDIYEVDLELYGEKYRKLLMQTEFEQLENDPHSNYGVKVPINGNMYQIYGIGQNICHIGTYVKRD